MAIEAELRYTLVDRYLALTAAGKVDKDERPLVMPPLFRAGSDGIVKRH
ncbi:MAG: DUF6161 domain-containing protein [Hyphomicrobiaceae bacterium]